MTLQFARSGKDGHIGAATMNKAYEILRTLTISQLCEMQGFCIGEGYFLMAYQCGETIRRKELKIWE